MCIDAWNYYFELDEMNQKSYDILMSLVNSKNQRHAATLSIGVEKKASSIFSDNEGKKEKKLEEINRDILRDAEELVDYVEKKFPHVLSKMERIASRFHAVNLTAYLGALTPSEKALLEHKGRSIIYSLDDLPPPRKLINDLLQEEGKTSVWFSCALGYYHAKRFEDFQTVLEKAVEVAESCVVRDDVQILKLYDALASYYIRLWQKERDKEKKIQWYQKATNLYTIGDKIQMYNQHHLLSRAYFCLLEGKKFEQSDAQFKFVLNTAPDNIPALLGNACVQYNRSNYREALSLYKKCLMLNPNGSAKVRLGIGYCLHQLGYVTKAKIAFERVLQLEPENPHALTALAIITFNSVADAADAKKGAQYLIKSFKVDPDNSTTINQLATFMFYKKEYEKSEKYANLGLQLSEKDFLKAESHYLLGRCFHQQNETELAIKHYTQAITIRPDKYLLPRFGLGQLLVKTREYEKAIECFEKIIETYPKDVNTKKALVMLYIRSPGERIDIKLKRETTVKNSLVELLAGTRLNDPTLLVENARYLERYDVESSINEIKKVIDIYQAKAVEEQVVPIELYNNLGVYLFLNKIYNEAHKIFIDCLSTLRKQRDKDESEAKRLELTLNYNLARSMEELGYSDKALSVYDSITEWQATYAEAFIRKGKIAQCKGDFRTASEEFSKIIAFNPRNVDALTCLGCLHMERKEYKHAQEKFDKIIKIPEHKNDPFAHLALGTIWLQQLYAPNRVKSKDEIHVTRAYEFFAKVLRNYPKNIYAANGIAILLAFNAQYDEARECFASVRENSFGIKDAWINLAHVYAMQKNNLNAIKMYRAAIERFGLSQDCPILMSLSKAYWKNGDLENAREYMEKAVNVDCWNVYAKFNLARIYQHLALKVMDTHKPPVNDLENAISYFKESQQMFGMVGDILADDELRYMWKYVNPEQSKELSSKCEAYLIQANASRDTAVKHEQEKNLLKIQQDQAKEEFEKEREEAEKLKKDKQLKRLMEMKEAREAFLNMTKDSLKLPDIPDDKRASKGGGGRKKKTATDDFVVSENEEEHENRRKRKTGSRKKRDHNESAAGGGAPSDESEDEERSSKRKGKKVEENLSAKQSAKIKSRAIVSSSEDSSDDNVKKDISPTPAEDRAPVERFAAINSSDSDSNSD
uniref:TPR_REGION domain-containing protein n=1 Tax=Rhabditophanes sp. KR3021 TaxID=114890 RepID=A0AC35TRU3_9BILA